MSAMDNQQKQLSSFSSDSAYGSASSSDLSYSSSDSRGGKRDIMSDPDIDKTLQASSGSMDSGYNEMSSQNTSTSKSSDSMSFEQIQYAYNSGYDGTYRLRSFESDQGYDSSMLSDPITETPDSNKRSSKEPTPALSGASKHYKGTLPEYLEELGKVYDYRSWNPIADIKDKLGPQLLSEAVDLMWEQDSDKEFEALNAARDGDERAVAFALFVAQSHKQLNTMNADRQTVLHIAVETCPAHLCRLLITRGADGAIADVWGDTPLHIAARHGRADVIKALCTTLTKTEVRHPYFRVPYKSLPQDNVQSYNHDGRAPVHLAAQEANSEEHCAALRSLARHARADMDYRRLGDGYAPAHIAIDNDDYKCLEACLRLGADSEVRNFKSETPQQLAYLFNNQNNEHKMVKLCQEFGAGAYQLAYAETESLFSDDMDIDEECMGAVGHSNLEDQMNQLNFDG